MTEDPLFRPASKTPTDWNAIARGLKDQFSSNGINLTTDGVLVFLCHIHLETGNLKSTYNYNFGNKKRVKGQPWTMFATSERINGEWVKFKPPHPQTHFSAYDTLAQGLAGYCRMFSPGSRYNDAVQFADSGNPEKFTRSIYSRGYFTEYPERYARGMSQRMELPDLRKAAEGTGEQLKPQEYSRPETWSLPIMKGDRNEDVRSLQHRLTSAGFDCKGVDGHYGKNTASAVTAFIAHFTDFENESGDDFTVNEIAFVNNAYREATERFIKAVSNIDEPGGYDRAVAALSEFKKSSAVKFFE
jgi:hypothetical protein